MIEAAKPSLLMRCASAIAPRITERIRSVETGVNRVAEMTGHIAALEQRLTDRLNNEIADLRGELMRTRRLLATEPTCSNGISPGPAEIGEAISLEEAFERLEKVVPNAYRIWRELLDVNAVAFDGFPTDSCSVEGHQYADSFRGFLTPYLRGRVLDIGCGPQPVPCYLESYPNDQIWGVDPLSRSEDHPFHFFRGLAEFLPWQNEQFDVAVISTSMDHVLLLDQSLDEVHRVLKPGGHFVVWVTFIDGSPVYDPYHADVAKIDDYHLFHFDEGWFVESIERKFRIDESFALERGRSCCSHFFALTPK